MFSSSYKIVNPSSEKSQYNSGSQVDFYVNHPDKALVQESFYLSGKLYITGSGNTVLDSGDNLFYDNWAGAHNFFSDISTEFDGFSNKENASFLPRMEKMKAVVSETLESLSSETKNTFELKCSKDIQTTQLAIGYEATEPYQSFSFKPNFVLNRVPSNIPYSKTGMVRITVRLNEVSQALYGADYGNGANFYVKDLKLNYRITDEDPEVKPLLLPIVQVSKPTLQASQLNSISVITPLPCSQMFCSFQSETSLNSTANSKVELSKPTDLKKITWYFNDSNNNFLTYSLDNDAEILRNGMLAIPGARPGNNSINWLNREELYVMGMKFGKGVIAGNTKISMDIESTTTLTKGTLFCYFMCFVEV